jgi:cell wall assembly regulator SMI1
MIKKYLDEISQNAITLSAENYTRAQKASQWIGAEPATDESLNYAQQKLNIQFPEDVIELYKTTNGTSEILKQTFGGFEPIENIDWLKNVQPETIEAYSEMGEEYVAALNNSIVIAGSNHPHMVLIIQPHGRHKSWRYWEFAHFLPGENEFNGIHKYLDRLNDFLIAQIKNKAVTENRNNIDE